MILAVGAAAAASYPPVPEQIHLSLTGARGEMAVDFVTAAPGAYVFWGVDAARLASSSPATATNTTLNGWTAWLNTALVTGLAPNTTYYYCVGLNYTVVGRSEIYAFVNEPAREGGAVWAMFADLGYINSLAFTRLLVDAQSGGFDYVGHWGDFAYDMDDDNSRVGNAFMNMIQPVAAQIPYLPSVGNHEAVGEQGGSAFIQYVSRFAGVARFAGARSGSGSNLWYSLNEGLVHLVVFCTETWIMTDAQVRAQLAWLRADLAAVDRAATPWVVAAAHKHAGMDQTNFTSSGLGDALMTAGSAPVDLFFVGHQHAYYRYYAIDMRGPTMYYACNNSDASVYTRCPAPVIVVTGAAGNNEANSPTCGTAPTVYLHACSANYGYGKLRVVNASTAVWRWETAVHREGAPDPPTYADEFTIHR